MNCRGQGSNVNLGALKHLAEFGWFGHTRRSLHQDASLPQYPSIHDPTNISYLQWYVAVLHCIRWYVLIGALAGSKI